MNRRQLIARAAQHTTLSKKQVRQGLEGILGTIEEALANGDSVILSDFGRFEMQTYPARRLHRFDGEGCYEAEQRLVPVFKPSAALRRRLRSKNGTHE